MKTSEPPYILIVEDDPDTQIVIAHILSYLDPVSYTHLDCIS